jgi:hypothetical protein
MESAEKRKTSFEGGWKQADGSRETQLLWHSPDGRSDVIGLCPRSGQLMLSREQAHALAVDLFRFAASEWDYQQEPPCVG